MTPLRTRALCAASLSVVSTLAIGETLRVATFNAELEGDGPGLLLRDLTREDSDQIEAVVRVIARTSPDILALQGIDWDYDGAVLNALVDLLAASGVSYSYHFAARPNAGLATDLDLDGDGRLGGPGDAQGFGDFTGQSGLAVLSRFPIRTGQVRDFSGLLWRDMPGALLPTNDDGTPFPSKEAQAIQRLSSTAHWIVPIELPDDTVLSLMTFHASPPVFDGPEDRNGRRNHDEILLWRAILDGEFGDAPDRFVLAGDANLDPQDSDGRTEAIRVLMADPRLVDPRPASAGAAAMPDQGHKSRNAHDTVDWDGIGRFRVDYVLPSAQQEVIDAGVFWPAPDEPGHDDALAASRHRLVWVDLLLD
ncbi:endonuclease/exonuclease/phosphatase family protein [Sedimentitalea todarodis]|uniref:Endonuclease/exonuclease/phosphatase family protein n=1 Tax=Sedimentitalea todarodis TaxID=1631240 RepID=A0ABU3VA96_9RHOB|nr:endonuclease/exonuclease/phosphatase family protein [Sedimentitalea todarodis]MDU9003101.1 endonuclease/exonuclease/phosphatase family protein [Sedimentitalea todarodis]